MTVSEIITAVDNFAWGPVLIIFSLGCGLLFSIALKFPQIRLFKQMLNCSFKNKKANSGLTPFQALSIAIGGRVGTGNITGTASAIMFGGPGAVFWMCVMAVICSASAYIESALAQVWKRRVNGEYAGGPSFYMDKGLKCKPIAAFYGIVSVVFLIIFAGVQTNAFSSVASSSYRIPPMAIAVCYTLLLIVVIFGGAKVIAGVADKVVPFMSVAYVGVALLLILINITKVPSMIALIFTSAFSANAVFGGMVGSAVSWGVRRGVFSNEAGLGSLAVLHGMSEGKGRLRQRQEAQKQGMWAIFEVFFDTIIGCSLTAFLLLCVFPHNLTEKIDSLGGSGAVAAALAARFGNAGGIVTAACIVLFAFATILAWFYIGDQALGWLMRGVPQKRADKICILYHGGYLASVFLGCVSRMEAVWAVSDIFNGLMAVPNLAALVLLGRKVRRPER